jgi:excisionase family DNA binding protein
VVLGICEKEMKVTLEQEDIQAIAEAVIEKLRPLLVSNNGHSEDRVFDKKGLAEYLNVSLSTINKLVSNKQIPHFKINHGSAGAVRFYKRDIDKWIQRQTIPDINPITSKRYVDNLLKNR